MKTGRGDTMNARELIVEADRIRQSQGLTQSEWCRRSGFDEYGTLVSRAYKRGNCKLTVLAQLLKPLGYELCIRKTDDLP